MFCSPPGRASAQLGPGRVKILRLAFQVTTASQQKKTPLFVFTSAPPATGQLLSRLITQPRDWLGKALAPGKHTIVFDFKYDGPGPGKGGTGVMTIDGKEFARKTIAHTIPILMSIDESFDIGSDTRTGVDDSYKLPFHFTGTIDKLTYKLGQDQMTAEDQKAKAEAIARVNDWASGGLEG